MTEYFTSDLHIGHANIIEFCGRPYESVAAMNFDLVRRWNSVVGQSDTVWIVGDVCMGNLEDSLEVAAQLRGKKILVPGNHDRMFGCSGTKWFNAAERYRSAGISTYWKDSFSIRIDGLHVLVSHFPYVGDSGESERYAEHRPVDTGSFLVHGHTHGVWRKRDRMIDVGVDAWNGTPVSFQAVADLFKSGADAEPLPWL